MKWKDSTLLQCLNKWVYSEKYGFCSCNIENIILIVSKTKYVGWNDIFVVKAENKNGDIIAKSRGIKSAYPQWFEKED